MPSSLYHSMQFKEIRHRQGIVTEVMSIFYLQLKPLLEKAECKISCLVEQLSWNNSHENAHMLIPTPDKDDDPVPVDYSRFIHLSVVPTRATPLPALG